jgi:hypothetical protein
MGIFGDISLAIASTTGRVVIVAVRWAERAVFEVIVVAGRLTPVRQIIR